ncbi:1,4-beta-D-glucan glucohydrolase [Sphingopyxis sp. H038]|uniref:glycoside hydrolase family 3 protein n=1 Tax=unclassified Sphingopyxis TaxID=2614943 RepID=UPI000731A062|nr:MULTISPECIES: glycoside hydrolase family 3 protein [unclassified Sphingopyxis]KTE03223.1 1,4-beta-D-glucan glucohydrolase [Sphingopyxis sp. H012]KTE08513.1 1,4-beta-D-glucan glucohydrolase [Sphingopyxis sp. H093]KTE10600.1 1,4-beta-D-glucan glucohydrolase [Sphingopyxis sp. H053]KTE24566.1 1,4-beta-D-glucan glucohydrolase [Sphingopyxis sp. H080]KTE36204.1 1,4-beta-D-glucan glucohydrolase [Sphingopyxis sp. H038]
MRRQAMGMVTALLLAGTATATAQTTGTEAAKVHPELWPAAKSPAAITDPKTEARIDALMKKMTIEQKVGQLIQGDISTITPKDLETYPLGSILAGGNSGPNGNERSTAADWAKLVGEFRAVSLRPQANGVAIPIIFGVDAVHGHNNIPGATLFPHNIGLGAARDPELIQRIGAVTAAEIAGSGIEWTFAPTLAVPQDLRWGRSYEGYAADPKLIAEYAKAMVLGLQGPLVAGKMVDGTHVAATAKHFLADGGTFEGKDQGDAKADEKELIAKHAMGYPAAIDAGALTVMASFSSWQGIKHHGNKGLLTDALKEKMGFAGFVVGDWNGHGQVAGCSVTDCAQSINAGLDMFMAPDSWKGLYETTLKHAKDGTISAARLDDAVRRILRVKYKLGLFPEGHVDRSVVKAVGTPEHLAVAREAVAKSLVLLKNNGSVLPIKPGARVLVTGPAADSMAIQSGGWTISWQGTDVTHADFPNGQTIWEALNKSVRDAGGVATLSDGGVYKEKPDVAIVVFGEAPYAEFQGDVATLDYQPSEATDLATLKKLKAAGIPVVALFLSGRPMFTNPEINAADAFVAGWLPGSQGAGVADVLVAGKDGKTVRGFTGTLPFAWPADARSPVEKPQFAVGYGLKYGASTTVPQLSEELGVDIAAALNVENYFSGGRARAPWVLTVTDAGGSRPVESPPVSSPGGLIAARSVDVRAQEDGKSFVWTGPAALHLSGPYADLSRQLNNSFALRIDWRVDAIGSAPVSLALGGKAFDVSAAVKAAPKGQVSTIKVPLRCFADAGANLRQVDYAVSITSDKGFAATLLNTNVEAVGENLPCPPAVK